MELKRLYKEDVAGNLLSKDGQVLTRKMMMLVDKEGRPILDGKGMPMMSSVFFMEDGNSAPPVQIGVQVNRAGGSQHFKPTFIATALQQGWGSMAGGKFTIHNTGGDDVVYTVTQIPGHYCCHCDESPDGEKAARLHVKSHPDLSPDLQNPAGYVKQNYFNCVKEN